MVLPYIEVGLPLGADQIQKFTVNLCSGGRQATDRWEQKRAKTWSRDQIWLKTSWWRCWLELMAVGWYWWPWTGVGAIGAAPMSSNIDPTAAACNAGANWKITGRRIWRAVRKLEGGGVSSDNGQPVSTDLKRCTRDISYDSGPSTFCPDCIALLAKYPTTRIRNLPLLWSEMESKLQEKCQMREVWDPYYGCMGAVIVYFCNIWNSETR